MQRKIRRADIPEAISSIARPLHEAGFQVYLVGGCVRDLLLNREPKDWDLATDARPEKIQELFPDSVYENRFGTVGVKTGVEEAGLRIVEVTTFRKEGAYSDARHPDKVEFSSSLEEDLRRRDFTVNAIALDCASLALVDPFGGISDLAQQTIRAVGNPEERFREDALRLLRAVRLAVELQFSIDRDTREAIKTHASLLGKISAERIRDEFIKLVMSTDAARGVILLEELGLLQFILPELREGLGVTQNKHHIYSVFEHNVRALDYAAREGYSLAVRTAALLHDVGKPRTKKGEGESATFYNHDIVGAKMVKEALTRLRFPHHFVEQVAHLVRYHLFYYNVGEVSEAGVRRFLSRVGVENIDDLIKVREADRIGSGVPKARPYKLRHLLFMIEKVRHDPISPKMLNINGDEIMELTGLSPGPPVGWILEVLLDEVLEDPSRNARSYLRARAQELARIPLEELRTRAKEARKKKEELEADAERRMKERYHVA
ncbi:HD domain-containing protein [Candidatus Parcubacteria bacterium]|nr:MAG: HD domain-containing protein [Candidatus Parcubacteria bacterium]